jgi:hypothetical protein
MQAREIAAGACFRPVGIRAGGFPLASWPPNPQRAFRYFLEHFTTFIVYATGRFRVLGSAPAPREMFFLVANEFTMANTIKISTDI